MSSNEEKTGSAMTAGNVGKNDGPPLDEDIRALFTSLDLKSEITVADFQKLTSFSVQNHEPSTENQLADTFLQRLLTINYNARYISVKKESTLLLAGPKQDQAKPEGNSGVGALFKGTNQTEVTKSAQIHPMDVQMAVFHHADHFLKQLIVTKLSQCQYALPLLVPNPFTKEIEFPLWTFQQIKKSWKIREEQPNKTTESSSQTLDKIPDKIISKSQSVCKIETPMVSFFRLSSDSSSKSQLMNSLINEKHNTFFHRNCPGSSRTRLLMEGVVEIAWYCPSGKPTDKFNDCVAFCNLHGDAACYPIQRRIVTEMATINIVFLSEQDGNCEQNSDILQDLFISPTPLICIFTDDENSITETMEGKYKLGIKGRILTDVSAEVNVAIRQCLSKQIEQPKKYFKVEELRLRSGHKGIKVDTEHRDCIKGHDAALEMMVLLTGKDPLKMKEEFLPCQGKLWHDWSQNNKELYRLKGENLKDAQSAKHKEMREIRTMQKENGLSKLMVVFVQNLITLSETEKKYFIKWFGNLLDYCTSEKVSELHHDYDIKWYQLLDLKRHRDKTEKLMNAQTDIEEILCQLRAATLGLEHFLREIGQVFEATGRKGLSLCLPKMAAQLMISGHPIELMDGDAAHVPLVWVTAILDKLIEELGDKRVFVLSVLGIQSSGKSTMLNAMFGLQFVVSAGRCTRGAFMQLVEVSEEIKELLKVDYILVVDTKGLKVLELAGKATVFNDSQLATFAVGLGNMALINIFGENVAEMQDILQIVVQAFLRMKQVNLNPRCIFVHQNVTAVTIGDKNMEGRKRLQEKLDEMTKLAAKEEVCDAECFSDVIAFDIENDVKYFAQLWEGSPPMAPPNPSYSENILDLKKTILSSLSQSTAFKLTEFKQRVETLWYALLKEDFVFSFKNTQEIAVHRKLEEEYGKWTWSLRSEMQKIEDKLHIVITNKTVVEIDTKLLEDEIKVIFENVKEEMKQYFENNEANDILIQRQTKNEIRLAELHNELVKRTTIKLNNVIVEMDTCKSLNEEKIERSFKLLLKSKELAFVLREKGDDKDKKKAEFDSMWTQWVVNLTINIPPTKDINIRENITTILSESHEGHLVKDRTDCEIYKSILHILDYNKYVTLIGGQVKDDKIGNSLTLKDQYSIRELIRQNIRKTDSLVNSKPVSTQGYNVIYIQEIADYVKISVKKYKPIATKFEFKKEFTVDLSLYVCHRAADKFIRRHQTYKEATDPHTYLETKKPEYYKVFQQYYTGANCAAVLGGLICSELREPILKRAYNETATDVYKDVKGTAPFQANKCNLEKHILISLAMEKNFYKFMDFFQNPRDYFENFIREQVEKHMSNCTTADTPAVLIKLQEHIKETAELVTKAAATATEFAKTNTADADTWLQQFSHEISTYLEKSCTDLLKAEDYQNIDFDLLADIIKTELSCVTDELTKSFCTQSDLNMEMFRTKPHEVLIEHFCDCCWVKCPFCSAVCVGSANHAGNHNVPIHRADGIEGWHECGTKDLCCNFCTTVVSTNKTFYPSSQDKRSVPYNNFRSAGGRYADWTINPDPAELPYWKWFVCTFQTELESYHMKKFQGKGSIPDEWRQYSLEDAIKSLDRYG